MGAITLGLSGAAIARLDDPLDYMIKAIAIARNAKVIAR